tara:strand:- start:393 stop:677 length:285 start_codon:yes stop_codon:yes gene_type:complete
MYEISYGQSTLIGVKFRGRIRKYALSQGRMVLAENAVDVEGKVRIGVPHGEKIEWLKPFILSIMPGSSFTKVLENVKNPILSKIKCNFEERYTI